MAFWGVMVLLTMAQRAIGTRFGPPEGGLETGEGLTALIEFSIWAFLTPVIFWMSRRFSLESGTWARHLLLHLGVAITVSTVLSTFNFWAFATLVPAIGWTPVFSVQRTLANLYFLDELIIFFVILAAGFARDYFLRYRAHLEEAATLRTQTAELQAQLAEARLHALRMQINPHFLFNTLNTISTYLERDPRGARRMIARLSALLRYTLDMTGVREVPLRQELAFLDDYLEIQTIRFQDSLAVRRDIDPAVLDALVPSLILQPLVENAIKHGVSQRESGGVLTLRAGRAGEALLLSVQDNGPGLRQPSGDGEVPQGIGIQNTRERLENLYGTAQTFALKPAPEGGLIAHICLPYHTPYDLVATAVQP